ncbi:hypothetical protein [Aquibium oceanicum]|uniref:hypothetical protein n=1 Tax=Aquibium oceanicum TaxID=1670800 RepID=UPI0012FFB360|nr:hypothetical protein [Aquibium oceanicum]
MEKIARCKPKFYIYDADFTAKVAASQAAYEGSIPFTRSSFQINGLDTAALLRRGGSEAGGLAKGL